MTLVNLSVTLTAALTALAPLHSNAAELQPETLKAWEEYVRSADSRMQARLHDGHVFLWADEAPGRDWRLTRGEILVSQTEKNGVRSVPNGLIHDWIGAAFIPHARLATVLNVVHDYDRYKVFYKPVVADSKVVACSPMEQRFSMLWVHRELFVTAALHSQYEARDFEVDGTRWYSIADTTQVQEIKGYGQPGERWLPPDQGSGFIWRLHSIARYEQRDGGVYVELEAIALTRDVPSSLGWLLNPVIERLSRNSLVTSLRQTREAIALPTSVRGSLIFGCDRRSWCQRSPDGE
jgi:hypothetical protein